VEKLAGEGVVTGSNTEVEEDEVGTDEVMMVDGKGTTREREELKDIITRLVGSSIKKAFESF
jgi:hypothetical protein